MNYFYCASSPSAYLKFNKLFDERLKALKAIEVNEFTEFDPAGYKDLKREDMKFLKSLEIKDHYRNLVGYPFT